MATLPSATQIGLITAAWKKVQAIGLQPAGELFFKTLFNAHPEGLALFKAFASLPECPSGDGYMQSLYEWAAGNLESGDLEAAFNEVDADGSGEMEYEEFRLMLSA